MARDEWWDRVLRILGLEQPRVVPPHVPDEDERAMNEARRRLTALDNRVDAIGRRLNKHERSPHR